MVAGRTTREVPALDVRPLTAGSNVSMVYAVSVNKHPCLEASTEATLTTVI